MTIMMRGVKAVGLMIAATVIMAPAADGQSATPADMAPWEDLKASLQDPDTLQAGSVTAWQEQCIPPFAAEDFPEFPDSVLQDSSGYQLFRQPSGQCMLHLGCAYEGCVWPYVPNNSYDDDEPVKMTGMNLPTYILHPTNVGDLVKAVEFCGLHKVPITVKTSGHSYVGASTRKHTLLIHMGRYPNYAIDDSVSPPLSFIQECADGSMGDDTTSAAGMSCAVAQSRNKTAFLRVGGGSVWDEALRSVWYWNLVEGNKEYHIVSGAAGTVSAAGGWLASGGNSGTTGMRMFGLGVDQVLHMEMVLPDGSHVRFGPSEWQEPSSNQLYPQTTAVTGFCNANPNATDEAEWQWEPCDKNFEDLWFATRGGGGGTYGVVTSLYYQLHDKPGLMQVGSMALTTPTPFWLDVLESLRLDIILPLSFLHIDFHIDFLFAPEKLNVTVEDSNNVGSPRFSLNPFGATVLWGYNGSLEVWVAAWQQYVTDNAQFLIDNAGLTEEQIGEVASWAIILGTSPGYGEPLAAEEMGVPVGRLPSNPNPEVRVSPGLDTFWHIPMELFLGERRNELITDIFLNMAEVDSAYILGGHVADGSDGMTAVPDNRREAGLFIYIGESLREPLLQMMYEGAAADESFPGILCHNHFGPDAYGPLKEDWTKPCQGNFPECFSQQESVFGTELLAKLEGIKQAVDPDSLFVVVGGVGYDDGEDDDTISSENPTSTPSSPSSEPPASTPSPQSSEPPSSTPSSPSSEPPTSSPSSEGSRSGGGSVLFNMCGITAAAFLLGYLLEIGFYH